MMLMLNPSHRLHLSRWLCAAALAAGLAALPVPFAAAADAAAPRPLEIVELSGQYGRNTKGFVCKIVYPWVMSAQHTEAAEEISEELSERAWKFAQNYVSRRSKPDAGNESNDLGYEVKCNDGRYFSLNLYHYYYAEYAAHPLYGKEGLTFNAVTGKLLKWKDLVRPADKGAFTLAAINQKLLTSQYAMNDAFFPDFHGLKKLPQNYYVDEQGYIHFMFMPYEIGPYASGLIDLNMEKKAGNL
ncbi:MAG TPA: hypothetical protein DHV71_01040 [Acidaminococcaceae bacterium]|nr:hypothetical protein [Acidaminococcaceae bacterium]